MPQWCSAFEAERHCQKGECLGCAFCTSLCPRWCDSRYADAHCKLEAGPTRPITCSGCGFCQTHPGVPANQQLVLAPPQSVCVNWCRARNADVHCKEDSCQGCGFCSAFEAPPDQHSPAPAGLADVVVGVAKPEAPARGCVNWCRARNADVHCKEVACSVCEFCVLQASHQAAQQPRVAAVVATSPLQSSGRSGVDASPTTLACGGACEPAPPRSEGVPLRQKSLAPAARQYSSPPPLPAPRTAVAHSMHAPPPAPRPVTLSSPSWLPLPSPLSPRTPPVPVARAALLPSTSLRLNEEVPKNTGSGQTEAAGYNNRLEVQEASRSIDAGSYEPSPAAAIVVLTLVICVALSLAAGLWCGWLRCHVSVHKAGYSRTTTVETASMAASEEHDI